LKGNDITVLFRPDYFYDVSILGILRRPAKHVCCGREAIGRLTAAAGSGRGCVLTADFVDFSDLLLLAAKS